LKIQKKTPHKKFVKLLISN